MMQVEQEQVILLCQPHQPGPEKRAPLHVEGRVDLLVGQLAGPRLPLGGGPRTGQVVNRQRPGAVRRDVLNRDPVDSPKGRAQYLVAADDLAQRRLEDVDSQRSPEPEPTGPVVGAARLQLVDEPEPLLCERDRHRGGPRDGHDRWLGSAARYVLEQGSQLGHGGALEHYPHGQVNAPFAAHA